MYCSEMRHKLINYKDDKTSLVFIEWRCHQSCWYFRPSFLDYCPSNLLSVSGSPSPPLSLLKVEVYSLNRQCVAGRGGGGGVALSCVGDNIPRRRGGPRQIKTHTVQLHFCKEIA